MAGRVIAVDEVIAEACTTLKNVTEQEKLFMRQWAFTAQRQIGFSNINKEVSGKLCLSDWSVRKPANLLRTIDLGLYNSAGEEILHKYKGFGTVQPSGQETPRIHQDNRTAAYGYVAVTEDSNYFNVEEFSDASPDDVYIIVSYFATMVDSAGLPMIPEYATLAIIFYIRAIWAMRKNDNRSEIDQNWGLWLREKGAATGKAQTPDMIEGDWIARTINSMIQKAGGPLNMQF